MPALEAVPLDIRTEPNSGDPSENEASLVVKGVFVGVGAREVEAPCRAGGAGRRVGVRTNINALGGEPGVASLLHDAGLVDVELTKHRLDIDLPPMEEFFPELISATPWAATFDELSDPEQRAVIARMDDAVSQRADGNDTTATMTAIVAEGAVG